MKQKLLEEKAALGFSLSGHLFSVYERELAGFPRTPLAKLSPSDSRVWMAGVVASARTQMTRRGRMVVVMLDDGTAQTELTVFNELFEKHRDKLKEDALLVVAGKAQNDPFSGNFRVIAEDLLDLDSLRSRYAARLRLAMNGGADAKRLQQLLTPYRATGNGACQVVVVYQLGGAEHKITLGDSWRVRPDPRLISDLGAWLSPANVEVVYAGT
jgi:DNA polymerase-3 subunit alpha